MKKYFKKLSVILLFLIISISTVFAYNYTDNFPRSKAIDPPAGLIPEQCPMFVSVGFDDNGDSTGMKWALDLFRPINNPIADGNLGTFDGTPARVTFFVSAYYADPNYIDPDYPDHATGARLNQTQWQNAMHDGHEIGNHTYEHLHGKAFTVDQWIADIIKAEQWYQKSEAEGGLGLARTEGFRTPFLEFGMNTFLALKQLGFTYDCSIEDPFDDYAADPRYYPWPYTLDEGTPQNSIGPVKGLWELPVHPLHDPTGKKITGFDWNVWKDAKSGKEYSDILKHSLDLRMQGNRHPFLIGAHSDYYSPYWLESVVSVADRRQAIVDFINYAQSLEYNGRKVVRIVPFIKIIEWM
jgi:peptidoglycan/xylan/chitin deacetylase (PgdA/CDA1 family)